MRVHRLISILLLIEAKGTIKAKEIAKKLEISVRTVLRDIDTLCEAGIPLVTTSGPNGGIRLMEGYSSGIKQLLEEDLISLYLSGIGIQPDKKSIMATKLNNALLKLQKNIPPSQAFDLNNIKNRFYFDDMPWWGEQQSLNNIDILMHSIFQSKILKIKYKKLNGELSLRRIYPYGIVVKRMDWYMIAFCEKNQDIRTFKCERIITAEVLEEEFSIPKSFSIEAWWKKSDESFKKLCKDNEKYTVILRIHKRKADILSNFEVIELQKEDDYLRVMVNMYDYTYAAENVMKYIGYVQILEPIELRTFVKKELIDIANAL